MGKLYLRNANEGDSFFILGLANNPECRKNSFNSEKIPLDVHMKWYDKLMHSDTDSLYVLMEEDIAVGQGRLELREGECRISYSLIPERRGCGYGKILVALLMKRALQDYPYCNIFFAEVLTGNFASQKIFEELSFVEKKGAKNTESLIYVMEREWIFNIPASDLECKNTEKGYCS
uniref:GNAT family N-acetyltransferase n=1 Tax=Lachnoclostridium phocaeense TaxID=1871021 RepID=UPI0026DD5C8B|nr:GNAT family N-acetyltransferase [Lachnoclostridium phocaeense]